VDTNCDPDPIDFPIPANDDAFKSIGFITHSFVEAILEGLSEGEVPAEVSKEAVESEG